MTKMKGLSLEQALDRSNLALEKARYVACRLCLVIEGLAQSGEAPTQATQDWAFDTLCEGLGDPGEDPILVYREAKYDHAVMFGEGVANYPTVR